MEAKRKGRPILVIENLTRKVVRLQGSDIILQPKEVKRVARNRVNRKLLDHDRSVRVTEDFEVVAEQPKPVVQSKKKQRRSKKPDSEE